MNDWHWFNWINVFFVFFSGWVAIDCWKDGRNNAGHLNAFACVINALAVLGKIT